MSMRAPRRADRRRVAGLIAAAAAFIAAIVIVVLVLGHRASAPPPPAPPTPTVTPSPSPTALSLSGYVRKVEDLLNRSASFHVAFSAVLAPVQSRDTTLLNQMHQSLVKNVLGHQEVANTVGGLIPPASARGAQELLQTALNDTIAEDEADARLVNKSIVRTTTQRRLKQALGPAAQAAATATTSRMALIASYNGLRSQVGLPPLPADFAF